MAPWAGPANIRGVPSARAVPLFLLLTAASAADATVMESLDLATLSSRSDRVVRATVRTSQSAWDAEGRRIFTRHTLDVTDVLSGPPTTTLTVFQWGGMVGDIGQRVVGEAQLRQGQDAVFFLEAVDHAQGAGMFRTVGLSQGVWPVFDDGAGTVTAGRTASSLTVKVPGQTRGATVLMPDVGSQVRTYVQLRTVVRQHARRTP